MPGSSKHETVQPSRRLISTVRAFRLTASGKVMVHDPELIEAIGSLERDRARARRTPPGS